MASLKKEEILSLLRKNPKAMYQDDDFTTYELINGELVIKPITYYNSSDNIKHWQTKLIEEHQNYPTLDGLEHSWNLLESDYNQDMPNLIEREKEKYSSPLSSFMCMVDMGFYPPPEVMLSILDCFQNYENMKGKVSLEEVFFGKKERGIGNYAARKARTEVLSFLDFNITCNHENKSQYEIAEYVISHLRLEDEPDSLLRQYRRYKKKLSKKQ